MNDVAGIKQLKTSGKALDAGDYQVGFGNEFETEAVAGALPKARTARNVFRLASIANSSLARPSMRRGT
ncbi:MAG: hypothetical protein IPO97_12950 [Sphingomonadales bacterium]|nr:hypothetical protein [Sphingomonadales bacterium]